MEKVEIHEKAGYLRDIVFSANDGLITTFAIVAGSTGASLSSNVVVILGLVNLLADGISMASGSYLGVKSEIEYEDAEGDHAHDGDSPLKHGFMTFATFIFAGFLPLIPFVFNIEPKFLISVIIVAISLFVVGASRSKITQKSFIRSGAEVFLIGGLAASVAYFVGFLAERYLL